MKRTYQLRKGFTLIELLIVIAIIGILIGLIAANFIGVRQRARDSQRKSDLRQIQDALEMYRSDQGAYPVSASIPLHCNDTFAVGNATYLQKVPCDPSGTTFYNGGNYWFNSNGSIYQLGACLENTSDPQGTSVGLSGCLTNWYYILNNP